MVRGSLRNISSSVATSLVTSARSYLSKAARTSATTSGISICNSLLPVQVMRLSPQGENNPIGSNEPFDRGLRPSSRASPGRTHRIAPRAKVLSVRILGGTLDLTSGSSADFGFRGSRVRFCEFTHLSQAYGCVCCRGRGHTCEQRHRIRQTSRDRNGHKLACPHRPGVGDPAD